MGDAVDLIVGQWVNIIQHPNGERKQLALRQNNIIDMLDDFLQYETDTAPGSSGSPTFSFFDAATNSSRKRS